MRTFGFLLLLLVMSMPLAAQQQDVGALVRELQGIRSELRDMNFTLKQPSNRHTSCGPATEEVIEDLEGRGYTVFTSRDCQVGTLWENQFLRVVVHSEGDVTFRKGDIVAVVTVDEIRYIPSLPALLASNPSLEPPPYALPGVVSCSGRICG